MSIFLDLVFYGVGSSAALYTTVKYARPFKRLVQEHTTGLDAPAQLTKLFISLILDEDHQWKKDGRAIISPTGAYIKHRRDSYLSDMELGLEGEYDYELTSSITSYDKHLILDALEVRQKRIDNKKQAQLKTSVDKRIQKFAERIVKSHEQKISS